jgi:hypothetical protein
VWAFIITLHTATIMNMSYTVDAVYVASECELLNMNWESISHLKKKTVGFGFITMLIPAIRSPTVTRSPHNSSNPVRQHCFPHRQRVIGFRR